MFKQWKGFVFGTLLMLVLIIIYVTVVNITNKADMPEISDDTVNTESVIARFEKNNPIDAYFDKYEWISYSTSEIYKFAYLNSEAWKSEMLNAYNLLLNEANPKTESPRKEIAASREAFIQFAENYSWISPYANFSNGFGEEFASSNEDKYSEQLLSGTGMPLERMGIVCTLYKKHSLELFQILSDLNIDIEYIFEPTEEMLAFFAKEF